MSTVIKVPAWASGLEREVLDCGDSQEHRFVPGRVIRVTCARCRRSFDPMNLYHGVETKSCPSCGLARFERAKK